VLVNRESASASEIVAGAIQDHDRGLVVGETSWGKGLVQSVYTLQYGAGLALTTSKYFTPSGRNIQRDYTSFFDYYMASEGTDEETPLSERETFKTATGRIVYGGGGITPDVIVKPVELSRVTQLLEVRSAIFDFAVLFFSKNPELTKDVRVTDQMLEEFAQFAASKEIAPLADIRAVLAKEQDLDFIRRTLRAEIIAAKYGFDASYPFRLEGDNQVARAIALFPEAEKLAVAAAANRQQMLAGKGGSRGADAKAAAEPKRE
jgi:carboxyl-terminal processing protease